MTSSIGASDLTRRLATLGTQYRQAIAAGRLDELAAIDDQRLQLAAELQQWRESAGQQRDEQDPELAASLAELQRDSENMRQLLISLKDELHHAIEQQRQMSRGLAGYRQATSHLS